MRTPSRLACFALTTLALAACDGESSHPSQQLPSHPTPAAVPATIGYGDAMVPQVRPQVAVTTPRALATTVALTAPSALVATPNGGALLVWAVPSAEPRPHTQLLMRTISANGDLGRTAELHVMPGRTESIDIAARTNEAMIAWTTTLGGSGVVVNAQRAHFDGSLLGMPQTLGRFRLANATPDGGTAGDHLGFPTEVVASEAGFAVAMRAQSLPCGTAQCPSVGVAQLDEANLAHPVARVNGADLTTPVVLVGSESTHWSLVSNFGGENAPAHIEASGDGPLAALGRRNGSLVAAWIHRGAPRAVIRQARSTAHTTPTFELVTAATPDAGTSAIAGAALGCANDAPIVTLTANGTSEIVEFDDTGADRLFAWAIDEAPNAFAASRARANATATQPASDPISSVTRLPRALLVARRSTLQIQRCNGSALTAPVTLPWSNSVDATATPN